MTFLLHNYKKGKTIKNSKGEAELMKQIGLYMPMSEWMALRSEALRLGTSITALCRLFMKKEIDKLVKKWEEKW